ncbi:MAG: (2Fe-2S)-binding protein [Deltaproteobacteria bacterium]|nr:(2Fe-2S)-binding protein [Deltaproteobacteria bacterium]
MFKQYSQQIDKTVTIEFEGTPLTVPATITVAAAVIGPAGQKHTRLSPVNGKKRAPYCFMGVCHECLMEIDGIPDQQACIIEVKEGMKIRRQTSLPGDVE